MGFKALGILAILAAVFFYGRHWGAESVQAEWDAAEKERDLVAARDALRRSEDNIGVTNAHRQQTAKALAASAAAENAARLGRAESDSLRDEILARDRASAEAGRIADEAAATALELFGECRARRVEVARAAGELSAQVAALQGYASQVCVK